MTGNAGTRAEIEARLARDGLTTNGTSTLRITRSGVGNKASSLQ